MSSGAQGKARWANGAGGGFRPILGWILGVGLLAAVLLLVHYSVGWGALLRPWLEVSPGRMALAFLLVLVSYALRTVRIHHYFSPSPEALSPGPFAWSSSTIC